MRGKVRMMTFLGKYVLTLDINRAPDCRISFHTRGAAYVGN